MVIKKPMIPIKMKVEISLPPKKIEHGEIMTNIITGWTAEHWE